MVVILHNVRSVHNVGSMFRTADGAGISKVYLTGFSPTPLDQMGAYRKDFIKTSLGSERTIPWERVRDPEKAIKKLRKEGYAIVALERTAGAIPYGRWPRTIDGKKKTALLLGNEVDGVPPELLEKMDRIFDIPMRGKKESLNVSVAFGIAAYELTKPAPGKYKNPR